MRKASGDWEERRAEREEGRWQCEQCLGVRVALV